MYDHVLICIYGEYNKQVFTRCSKQMVQLSKSDIRSFTLLWKHELTHVRVEVVQQIIALFLETGTTCFVNLKIYTYII